ncbi:MAG: lysostaphin resistance A-like protein, partial [Promethearchaeota archaeon]
LFIVLMSSLEIILVLVPLVLVKNFRKPLKERFLLLGWRPYYPRKHLSGENSRSVQKLRKSMLKNFSRDILISIIIAFSLVGFQFIISILNDLLWAPFNPPEVNIDADLITNNVFDFMMIAATMLLIIGPTEEFLFRGYMQQGLEANLGERKALLITALFFTIAHVMPNFIPNMMTLYLFVPYFSLALIFSFIYQKTKNINLMIFIHGIYDTLLVLYSFFIGIKNINLINTFEVISLSMMIIVGAWLLLKAIIPLVKSSFNKK